ncbi:HAMP domain-containing sensor histidine kinase [Thalassotalea sp. SU-HH00458]|uniref:sensor histidine kinase n=1 Tax=Thalassotalea sp. SU-HH00458 TaxID=3127657 RepID=UPI0031083EE4
MILTLMNLFNFKSMAVIQRLFLLRSLAIIIQVTTVLIVYYVMSLQISLISLLGVIGIESLFHLISIYVFRNRPAGNWAIVCQLLADIFFLSILLSLSGGATNAFVSLLLLPIIIAAVSLPSRYLSIISLSAISSYSLLLFRMPEHAMHQMDMSNHFFAMWANFLLSVVVVTIVVGTMARIITNREKAIAKQREEQLKSEQLLSLGVASAQVTHQLATPLANIQLLYDELLEDHPEHLAVQSMHHPLEQCREQLGYFRSLAASIREESTEIISVVELLRQLNDSLHLHFPEQMVDIIQTEEINASVQSDDMLIAALLNLIQNAIRANKEHNESKITVTIYTSENTLNIEIRDFGAGIEANLNNDQKDLLGEKLVESSHGLGMAVLLSNTTINRLKGSLKLANHPVKGCVAHVKLALVLPEN